MNSDGSKDFGLWQINDYWQRDKFDDTAELLDAETNTKIAYQIWQEWGNFNAWSSWKNR